MCLAQLTDKWHWDSQEEELPLLKHSGVSVAANEKVASRSTGSLGVPELSLGMAPDLIQCENTNLASTQPEVAEPNKQLNQVESQSKLSVKPTKAAPIHIFIIMNQMCIRFHRIIRLCHWLCATECFSIFQLIILVLQPTTLLVSGQKNLFILL